MKTKCTDSETAQAVVPGVQAGVFEGQCPLGTSTKYSGPSSRKFSRVQTRGDEGLQQDART